MNSFFDSLWGTRMHTQGAQLQLPRKIPMRVEPKSYFANERTFLSWAGMAVTMGGVSSAMLGFSITTPTKGKGGVMSKKTVDIITCMYVPLAILMIIYALFTFQWRSRFMAKKQIGFFDDRVGPLTLGVLVLLSLLAITIIGFVDYFSL